MSARDLLPAACRRRRGLTARLLGTFERWGYEPVITPIVEDYETFARGLSPADQRLCVRFVEAGSGDVVALRSDVTPQIARLVAQRAGGELAAEATHRLCYAADIVRQRVTDRQASEHHQVGVELIGDADPHADAELIALCTEALTAVGLAEFRFDLAHRRVAGSVLEALGLATDGEAVRYLARKDGPGLAAYLDGIGRPVPAAAREAATALCDLYGAPEILARAESALPSARAGIEGLRGVLEAVHDLDPSATSKVTLDLGEVRGFDYYTGLRLRVWAPGASHPVVRGGRYDATVGSYGAPAPATGFAIDLDELEAALAVADGAPTHAEPAPAHVVAVADAQSRRLAARAAAAARAAGRRSWVTVAADLASAQALADSAGAQRLTFVDGGQTDQFVRGADGWRRVQEDDA